MYVCACGICKSSGIRTSVRLDLKEAGGSIPNSSPSGQSLFQLQLTLGFQGPNYWVLKGSRALTIRVLEA